MTNTRSVTTNEDIDALLAQNAVVALSISGGKDGCAAALAVTRHLDSIGHSGPRVLVHADLGRVEWRDSLPVCEKLAAHLGLELIVVRRPSGDMLARWESRWDSGVARYANLSTVRLVMPWSSPQLRFCTSEMKSVPMSSALRKRFPKEPIISVDGVRGLESRARALKPIAAANTRLMRKDSQGLDWHAIHHWTEEEVFAEIAAAGLEAHEAYTVYGSSRVSCAFCIMGSLRDLTISAGVEEHLPLLESMVDLECRSTFGFQGNRWLAEVAPQRLSAGLRDRVEKAKRAAEERVRAEASLPASLLFARGGWPTYVPSEREAQLLADVRKRVAEVVGIAIDYTTVSSIRDRYETLIQERDRKSGKGVLLSA